MNTLQLTKYKYLAQGHIKVTKGHQDSNAGLSASSSVLLAQQWGSEAMQQSHVPHSPYLLLKNIFPYNTVSLRASL